MIELCDLNMNTLLFADRDSPRERHFKFDRERESIRRSIKTVLGNITKYVAFKSYIYVVC